MAPLSEEENNYIRLALLLLGVSPRAVRTFFDKEFHPSNLHSTLNKNKPILHGLRLNLFQWNLLFPKNGLTNSSNFDVTLMILLIRNLTPVTPPLTGFDKLPTKAETSAESDLARIKWYRNILAHLNSDKIDTVFFNTAWGDIIEAVCRLGGKQMKDECQDLKVKILDQSNQELMNEIKNSQREIRELQDIINRLHNKVRRNCTSALDILGGQIKKQSNQEITIAIKKAEREIRELGDIIERFNNKLWRCQSCSDIKDLTGEEVKYERGNTQIVIDQTKNDHSKTSKRKRHNAENEAGHMHTNYKLVDGSFKSKIGEHSTTKCVGTNQHFCSSDNSSASSASYVSFPEVNQVHTNPTFIGDSGESVTYAAYTPTTSINSDYDDPTTTEFMLQPGIHVPSSMKDTPNFNNIMRMGNMQFLQQHQVTSSYSTFDNNEFKLNDENEVKSEPDQTSNCSRHDRITWPKIDRPTVDEVLNSITLNNYDVKLNDNNVAGCNPHQELDPRDHVYLPSVPDDVSIQGSSYFKSQKKKYNWRKWIIIIFVCSCLSVVAALIVQNEYGSKKETPDDQPTPSLIVDKCENDISTATVGEQICIPYTQQFTSHPSGIQVKQVSSQYFSALPSFYINVSADTVSQKKEDWIINYNISRPDQPLRFMKENATCDSIGIYEITIEYEDGNVTSFKFEISFGDPQLEQSVTRLNDKVYVHCEMKKTCMASSLALFVNDGGSSRLIPDIDVCSFTDKNSGTTVSADAILHVSQLSENHTISCVPLMTNMELSANLTSTSGIPVCEGDCVPDCKDDPQGETYFPDKNDCSKFHQCSNGQLVSQSCSPSTYWSTRKCTCLHFDDDICNRDTKRFLSPLLSIEKCTNASLV